MRRSRTSKSGFRSSRRSGGGSSGSVPRISRSSPWACARPSTTSRASGSRSPPTGPSRAKSSARAMGGLRLPGRRSPAVRERGGGDRRGNDRGDDHAGARRSPVSARTVPEPVRCQGPGGRGAGVMAAGSIVVPWSSVSASGSSTNSSGVRSRRTTSPSTRSNRWRCRTCAAGSSTTAAAWATSRWRRRGAAARCSPWTPVRPPSHGSGGSRR